MTGHGSSLAVGRVPVDGVSTAFAKELTPVAGEVTDQLDTLHSTETASASRTTSWPSASRRASSRLACTMS